MGDHSHMSTVAEMTEQLRALVEAIRSSRAPAGVATCIVAIDGPGGAGKSSLANRLAEELGAPVVRTDDFASWENPVDWWPELIETRPRARRRAGSGSVGAVEEEDRYVDSERPAEHADRVLRGDQDIGA